MKYLIDTQLFIWLNTDITRLTRKFVTLSQSGQNEFYLSMASVWEMQIKQQLGKLSLPTTVEQLVKHNQAMSNLNILNIDLKHIGALESLPDVHKDPSDRLIIAQSLCESMTLISADQVFQHYPVQVVWS